MPQYRVGHVQQVGAVEHLVAAHRGLELAGNAYRGVGIPQCIHSGQAAAARLAEALVPAR
jgi:oxygen-dependent protoporphyrinogen oxidase